MQIALLGGTGEMGEGLALRWGRDTDHGIVVGSRDPERAVTAAQQYEATLANHGHDATIEGVANTDAAARADVVVCTVPAYHLAETIESVADGLAAGDVLVTPAVGMKRDGDGMHYNRPSAGSVTALAAGAAPEGVPVVGAFHSLAARRLATLGADLDVDTLVVGDDEEAVETVVDVATDIAGLRALSAGPLTNAAEVEALTPLLINVSAHNDGFEDAGVKFD